MLPAVCFGVDHECSSEYHFQRAKNVVDGEFVVALEHAVVAMDLGHRYAFPELQTLTARVTYSPEQRVLLQERARSANATSSQILLVLSLIHI